MATTDDSGTTEFKLAREHTRHSREEIRQVLGVSDDQMETWDNGSDRPPPEVLDWLWRNRNQTGVWPLSGLQERRGESQRPQRAVEAMPAVRRYLESQK